MKNVSNRISLLAGILLLTSLQLVNARQVMISSDCPNLNGQITYLNTTSTPLYDVMVCLQNMSGDTVQVTTTDYLGNYSFCITEPGTYLLTASSNKPAGGINSTDALVAGRHFVEQITLSGLKLLAADVNNNGYVNTTDALLILRRFVGQISTFPAGDWVFEMAAVSITGSNALVQNLKGLCYGDLDGSFIPPGCTPLPTQANAGPDQTVTGTSTTLAGNTPASGTGTWSILSGTGGNIAEPGNPLSEFSGTAGNTYVLAWTISTVCTGSADEVSITFENASSTCGSPFTDTRDGQVYNTVQIGTQCWMQQSLNIGAMVTSSMTGSNHSDCSNNGIIEKYCFNNNPANCDLYGGLYDWNEMMNYSTGPGLQGICPTGWHIPTDSEWCALSSFLDTNANCNTWGVESNIAGGKMKETGTEHWNSPNTGATNESGFTALPTGYRHRFGNFSNQISYAYYWSSSESLPSSVIYRFIYSGGSEIYHFPDLNKNTGYSVRCLRDCTPLPDQSNAGPDQTVTGTSTTLAGNTPVSGIGTWSIISGENGNIAEPGNPLSEFSGTAGNTYVLAWTISTVCTGIADEVSITFENPASTCGSLITDIRDGQVYNTIQIGSQCWMQQNLNIGTMVISVDMGFSHSECSNNGIIEKYCYNNDPANCAVYGGMYDWDEMMGYTITPGVQGICPEGWHIPTDAEWCALSSFLDINADCNSWGIESTIAGGKMKETGLTHWDSPNTGATNESGFAGLPCGDRYGYGGFSSIGMTGYWWSSNDHASVSAWYRSLNYDSGGLSRSGNYKLYGYSVRCLRD